MRKFPEVNVSFEELYRMFVAPIRAKLMLTGIELGVFNQLSEPRSAEAVAKEIGTIRRILGFFWMTWLQS